MSPDDVPETSSADLQKTLTGGQQFMKIVIICLSVLYAIFGAVLCAVGSYALSGTAANLAGQTLPKGLIAVGSFLMITAIIGGLSAWKEFRLGLGLYFGLLALWSIILISVGIAVYVKKGEANIIIGQGWRAADPNLQTTIQNNLNCCGRYGANDKYEDDSRTYPSGGCPGDQSNWPNLLGCAVVLTTDFQANYNTAGACGIAFSVLMFVGLAFTCFLMKGIKAKGYGLAIEKNRARTAKEREEKRRKGKGGMKIPENVL